MNKISQGNSFVEQLKSQINIVDVVSSYVTLNKKGRTFWGCCPFHLERTPSFAVNFEEQYYHCFGCGESGDVITFVEKQENCDFIKALEILSKQAGLEMPEFVFNEEISKLKKKKEAIFKVNKEGAKHYNKNLFSDRGKNALDYLKKRGLSNKTIMQFGLGVSLDWNEVVNHLTKQGFNRTEILDSGIADQKNGRLFDFFGERIVFPIINTYGDVVGFSGRTMKADKTISKYKNTRDTIVFDKSRCVFALNLVKKFKKEEQFDFLILAEGQMDVMKLFEAGYHNAVASLGTALTKYHAKELKRFCDKVVVCYDGDVAGQKATMRSLDILESENLQVTVVSIPGGLDPDEYISKFGRDAFDKLLKNADGVVDYKLKALKQNFDLNKNNEKSMYIKKALAILQEKKDAIDAEVYLSTIANLTGVSKETLKIELNKTTAQNAVKVQEKQEEPIAKTDAFVKACRFYIAALLHKKPYAQVVDDPYFKFGDAVLTQLFEFAKQKKPISLVFDEFDIGNSPQIKDILNESFDFETTNAEEKFYRGSVVEILTKNLLREKAEITKEFKQTKNPELLVKLQKIDNRIQKLKQEMANE